MLVLSFLKESHFYLGKTKEYICEAVSESEACWSLKVGVNQFRGKELYFKETIYHSLNFVKNTLNFLTLCFLSQSCPNSIIRI